MAAPHVTAIAAMVLSYNSNYTIYDAKEAILNGGRVENSSFSAWVKTGKVADALGAIRYVQKPGTPTAAIIP